MSTGAPKPIRLSRHARGRLLRRGVTEAEVEDTIRTAPWQPAFGGRQQASKVFSFQAVWNGKYYVNKRVRPVFIERVFPTTLPMTGPPISQVVTMALAMLAFGSLLLAGARVAPKLVAAPSPSVLIWELRSA